MESVAHSEFAWAIRWARPEADRFPNERHFSALWRVAFHHLLFFSHNSIALNDWIFQLFPVLPTWHHASNATASSLRCDDHG